ALADVARRRDAWLMSDDAHGLGVLANGRGSAFADGQKVDVPVQMGTLSKARTLIYSTGLPPASAAAAIAALEIIAHDPALVAQPLAKAHAFTRRLNL